MIDIVPLLRNYPHEEMQFEKGLMTAAADEIERLRVAHPRQTMEEIVENCLRIWFFNYDETSDHSGHRIAMAAIVDFVFSQAGEHADQNLVDKYRDPKTGKFEFPGDVAKIIRKFEADAGGSSGSPLNADRPLCAPMLRQTGETCKQVIDMFRKHGLHEPPVRLRDELVIALEWAWYGQAIDPSPQTRESLE